MPASGSRYLKSSESKQPLTGLSEKRLASLERKFDVMIEHMQGVRTNAKKGKETTPIAPGILMEQEGNSTRYKDVRDELKKGGIKLGK